MAISIPMSHFGSGSFIITMDAVPTKINMADAVAIPLEAIILQAFKDVHFQ